MSAPPNTKLFWKANHQLKEQSIRRFFVRDLSDYYGTPTFDLIFYDDENGVERSSEAVWSSKEQAALEAEHLDAAQLRPVHWEVCRLEIPDTVSPVP